MFPQLDDTPTVFDELTKTKQENQKLKIENERLRKRIEKDNFFEQMLKDLITEQFGIKEFSPNQTIYGSLAKGIRDLKFQNSLVECEDCKSGIDTPTTSGKWLCDDCIDNRLAWEEAEAEHINESFPK